MRVSRRRLLGALAAGGAASLTGVTVFAEDAVAYTDAAVVGDGPGIRVDWRETYNGTVLEGGDETADGPVLSVGNALPGDSGTLAFRVASATDEPVRASMAVTLEADAENGRVEPERTVGDVTEAGELADALEVAVWYDTGSFGVSRLGGCDGERNAGETTLVDGSLRDVDDALAQGTTLGGDCLGPDEAVCVGISWRLPADTGNVVQTDTVSTDLSFSVAACGGGGG